LALNFNLYHIKISFISFSFISYFSRPKKNDTFSLKIGQMENALLQYWVLDFEIKIGVATSTSIKHTFISKHSKADFLSRQIR
jgi:hypothetical protein